MRGFVINAVLVLWRRILSRCAPIADSALSNGQRGDRPWHAPISQFWECRVPHANGLNLLADQGDLRAPAPVGVSRSLPPLLSLLRPVAARPVASSSAIPCC